MNDHKAAKAWAEKYQATQSDSTVGNCMRCYLELRELAEAATASPYGPELTAWKALRRALEE